MALVAFAELFEMHYANLVWIFVVLVTKDCQPLKTNTLTPVLFTLAGRATLKTSYAHLVIPLHLPAIKESFDRFEDLEKAMNQLTSGTDSMSKHKNEEVRNL